MSQDDDTTEGIEAALPKLETVSPFSSPPYSVEIDLESPGGVRHRVRVEGQVREECLDDALRVLDRSKPKNLEDVISTLETVANMQADRDDVKVRMMAANLAANRTTAEHTERSEAG